MNIRNLNITLRRGMIAVACLAVYSSSFAQSPIFGPGNILVSRTTYTGTSSTVPFPGLLPNNSASVADGTFPNVFNNETPDGSFGVTSPIFIDQVTPTGGLLSTIPLSSIISGNISTSFSSKSELGLNVTPDGGSVTFMAYGAPTNALDVSNANTPAHVDTTNPVDGQGILINQRDIIQLSGAGAAVVTTTNGYSGNNGRNTVLGSNGYYYTVGNAGNNGSSVTLAAGTVSLSGTTVTLSGASTTANINVGTPFSGTNIPTGTYVTAITNSTQFTISAAATGAAGGSYVANAGAFQLTGVSFTTTSTTVTVASTANLVPGMPLSGTGFATGSYIASVTNATQFVASALPTANSSPTASYTAGVSNSMLSDDTGVRMILQGSDDTTGTGTGILDAVTNSQVVGIVNGSYGTTPGYQRGFTITQIDAVLNGTTTSGSAVISGLNPSVATETANNIQLYSGLAVTGPGIPSSTTISSVNAAANTITLSKNATASGAVALTFGPAADKSGKDDNFRGLTNYNNTLYVSKGSGSNGLDAVYQVNPNGGGFVAPGTSAGLPTPANAASTTINPLPGWPTGSTGANEGKTNGTTVHHPFGIWFANSTTMYVGDEGLANSANAATGGLEKWIYNSGAGIWEYQYTLPASGIPSYSVSTIGPLYAEGLRNIAGIVNGDGTVTVYGITSTAGATLNDEGADPNQLVVITDSLAATSLPNESFTVLETAAYGNALRGVAFIPTIAPTVTFTGAPATAAYGSGFTVSATTNASTTATITASGACTVSGYAVTMTSGTGTCILTATWAGDGTYSPATATQSTAAMPAVLTVTANNVSQPYGSAIPTLTAAITGFVNGDGPSVVSGSPALATTATPSSLPGMYPITVGLGTLTASNYTFTLVNGTLTITATPGLLRLVAAGGGNLVSNLVSESTGALGQAEVVGGPFSLVASDPGGRFVYAAAGATLYGGAINSGTGALTPIPGFPYSLPAAINAVAEDATGSFLYVGTQSSVYGATIDPATGELTLIPGSPFAVAAGAVNALVSDPAGTYLYAAANGVSVLAIAPGTGALTEISGSPFGSGGVATGLAMDPLKRFLFVSGPALGGVPGYAINSATGALTPLAGSPFFFGAASAGMTFDGSGNFLYALQSSPQTLWGFAVNGTTGNLTPVAGAPFQCVCNGVTADASGSYVFAIDNSAMEGFQITPGTGALTFINGVGPGGTSIALVPPPGSAPQRTQSRRRP
jgi:hypothetical protein